MEPSLLDRRREQLPVHERSISKKNAPLFSSPVNLHLPCVVGGAIHWGSGVMKGSGVEPGSGRPLPVKRLMARTVMS